MTVTSEVSLSKSPSNGISLVYNYEFKIYKAENLRVFAVDADDVQQPDLNYPDDYTITAIGNNGGGTVVLEDPIPIGYTLFMIPVFPLAQSAEFDTQGDFDAKRHEDAFDLIHSIMILLKGEAARSIQLNVADDALFVLPLSQPNTAIGFNADRELSLLSFTALSGAINTVFSGLSEGDFLSYKSGYWENITNASLKTLLNIAIGDVSGLGDIASRDAAEFLLAADANQWETGDSCYSYRASKEGWVLATGTIGSAASGATTRANADAEDLFALLWGQISNAEIIIQTSAGVDTVRGVSAAADWAANKRLPVPDERGKTSVGRDDMGGVAAGVMSLSRPEGLDGEKLGASGGAQDHQNTVAEMPMHAHNEQKTIRNGGGDLGDLAVGNDLNNTVVLSGTSGGDEAHNNVQPSIVKNAFIKL